MTEQQALELIGARAEELSRKYSVKQQCEEMLNNGTTIDEVEAFVYKLAIATLCGKGE